MIITEHSGNYHEWDMTAAEFAASQLPVKGHVLYTGEWPITDSVPLQSKQASAWENIKAERERRRFNGVLVAGKWFHTDPDSRTQHLSMVILGASLPAGIEWKTMDGSKIIMTPALVSQIFAAELNMEISNFDVAENHNTAMRALADPTDYNYSTGWTATYEPAP